MADAPDRPYHHGDLRRTLLDTAMAMLDEEAGWRFTLRELARRAGVSHAAPYKHFADKGALLAEMAMIGFDRLRASLEAVASMEQVPSQDAFLVIGRTYVAFGMANPALYRLMFAAQEPEGVHLSARAQAAFAVLVRFLEHGQAAGALRKRPLQAQAAASWAQAHGLTMLSIDGLLATEKVGADAIDAALLTLFEGLRASDGTA